MYIYVIALKRMGNWRKGERRMCCF